MPASCRFATGTTGSSRPPRGSKSRPATRLLADAVARGRHAELYLVGLNLAAQGLAGRVGRALTLGPGLELRPGRTRLLHFPQAAFWFEATFLSDQKEQDLVPVAVDLHHGRQVRHLER